MTDRDPFAPLNEQEELLTTSPVHESSDEGGDEEIILPVPEYAEPLRQALARDWGRKPHDLWWYWDANGNKSFAVVRFDDANGKTYRPYCWVRSATGEGWKARMPSVPRPLFNLNQLTARPDAPVLVVEGEKCAKAAESVFPDRVVVTTPGGAQAARKADLTVLAQRPEVMIWPDADEVGSSYAKEVASILHTTLGVSNVGVVDANTLASRRPDGTTREPPPGWDVADAVEEGWRPEALRKAALEAAKPWAPAQCSAIDPTGTNGTNGTEDAEGVANAWEHPDLALLGAGRSAPPPFPVETLGEFWGPWCSKHAMVRNAPVDYVAGALLAVTGALIGNKRWPYAGGEWGEPPILWVGLVGMPGSGKSPAQDPVLDVVRQLEREAADEMAAEVTSYKEKVVIAKAASEKWKQDVKKALKNDEANPREAA